MKNTNPQQRSYEQLVRENADLRQRLEVAEESIQAIRGGEVDALVVQDEQDPLNKLTIMRIVAEEILAQSILEQVADAVVICDDQGYIQRASNAVNQLYHGNPLGKHFEEVFSRLIPTADGEGRPVTFAKLASQDSIKSYEVLLAGRLKDDPVHFLLSARVLRSLDKQPVKLVITLTDISEGKKSEAILREADRRKDEFLATLAHELRNPIAPLQNALSLITLPQTSPEIRERAHEIMRRQLLQMKRLVDDLLDISRITRNRIELDKSILSLSQVIENAVETVTPLIRERNHKLAIKLPPYPVYVDADMVRLSQVFSNVLNNAAKYTSPGGEILVHATVSGKLLSVSISDNGIGIDPATLPHIFDLFMQADYSLERSYGGLGIGLTLVKSLVEQHNGTIAVKSAGLDKGSEFIITLPLADANAAQMEEPLTSQERATTSLKILVVDDNTASADTIGWLLEVLGHKPHILYEGSKLVAWALELMPDVILLDIGLPGKNGYDLCRELRTYPQLDSTLLIAQTGWGQDKDKSRAIEAGFDHHLIKPFQLPELQALLEKVSQL
jgi:signal transduction histidine kinase/ActR/RegA family two-component response regulator